MTYYANVADLTEIDTVGRMIIGDWFDTDDIATLDSGKVDGDYLAIVADDDEQADARAEILSDKFSVRVEERA